MRILSVGIVRASEDSCNNATAESQVAVWVADGKSVRDIALATGLTEGAIYWHLKQIYRKLPISRQVDLVRLVLSIAEFG